MRLRQCDPRRALGFSLIEVLVALAIAAMVVGIGLPTVSDSLMRQSDARIRHSAVALARSKMDEFSASTARHDLPRSGVMDDLRWRVSVSEVLPSDRVGSGAGLMMERVAVEVSSDQDGALAASLAAYRLKPIRSP